METYPSSHRSNPPLSYCEPHLPSFSGRHFKRDLHILTSGYTRDCTKFTSNAWLPWMTLRSMSCIRNSFRRLSVPSARYSIISPAPWNLFLGSRLDPPSAHQYIKPYTELPFRVTLMRLRHKVKDTDSPVPMHSCRSLSSIWKPTLRAKATSKMDISTAVSNNRFARSSLIFLEALDCLNHLVKHGIYSTTWILQVISPNS